MELKFKSLNVQNVKVKLNHHNVVVLTWAQIKRAQFQALQVVQSLLPLK